MSNPKIAVVITNGFEDIETVTPTDIWARFDFKVDFYRLCDSENVKAGYAISLHVPNHAKDLDVNQYDAIFIPGGPQYKEMYQSKLLGEILNKFKLANKWLFAICAAPTVLATHKVIDNKKATCFFGMDENFKNVHWTKTQTQIDDHLITGRGPGAAVEFGFLVASQFVDKKEIEEEFVEASFLKTINI